MSSAIDVKNLSLSYDFAENKSDEERMWIFKDLNFQIEPGQFILLTGPSGCGKSSLMNLINGVIPNLKNAYTRGQVYIQGTDMTETPFAPERNGSAAFQNLESKSF